MGFHGLVVEGTPHFLAHSVPELVVQYGCGGMLVTAVIELLKRMLPSVTRIDIISTVPEVGERAK